MAAPFFGIDGYPRKMAMTDQLDSFIDVFQRLEGGDEDAAAEIFKRFSNRLIGLAHSRLDSQLRQKVDAEDVAQSALKSFFRGLKNEQFQLDNWDALWALLVVIALRKCNRRIDSFRAACRDVSREITPGTDSSLMPYEAVAREPTPLEAVTLGELLSCVMNGLE